MKYGEFSVMMAKIEGILKDYRLAVNGVMAQLDNSGDNETAIDISIGPAPVEIGVAADTEELKSILKEN